MGGDWQQINLGDLVKDGGGNVQTGPFGSQLHAHDYVDIGIPCIMPVNIGDKRINLEGIARITELDAARLSKHLVKKGDIVYSRRGDVTRKALIGSHDPKMLCGTGCLLVQPGSCVDSEYLYYHLSTPATREWITRHAVGATMPNLNTSILAAVPLRVPNFETQISIVRILSTLDDKIELNRQTNQTLEAMAQALFKSWFVDFDPVIDNALAAGNDIPEPFKARAAKRQALGDERKPLPEEIRREFPDGFELVDEMGWVPRGWEARSVYDVATFVNGASFKSDELSNDGIGLPIVKIAEVKNGFSRQTKFFTAEKDEKYLIQDGEILFSWSGNPDTSIDTFIWFNGRGWLNQHIFKVIPDKGGSRTFVYNLLKYLKPIFTSVASNKQTTGLGHVTVRDLKRLKYCTPSDCIHSIYASTFEPIGEQVQANHLENNCLLNTRDTLLPKLLSGQLSIPDAEKLAADIL